MGTINIPARRPIEFEASILRIGLGDAPTVSLALAGETVAALPRLAAARAIGEVTFGDGSGNDLSYAIQLLALNEGGGLSGRATGGEPGQWLHARIAPVSLTNWFEALPDKSTPPETLVYQRGPDEELAAFLKAMIGGKRFLSDGAEKRLTAPLPCAAVLRQGWAMNRVFLDQAMQALAWHDPALLGWRALPKGDGQIVLALARDTPQKLDDRQWKVLAGSWHEGPNGLLRVECAGKARKLAPYAESLPTLFGDVFPSERILSPEAIIPAVPGLVILFGREWMVREVAIRETTIAHTEKKAAPAPDSVVLTLDALPAPPPMQGTDRVLDAVVAGWADAPEGAVEVTPAVGSGWRMAPDRPEHLLARYVMPARFGGKRGGLYLRPEDRDPRLVQVATGAMPVSWGAVTERQEAFELDAVDIALVGAKVAIDAGGGSTVLLMDGKKAALKSEAVEIAASVAVKGDLDIS